MSADVASGIRTHLLTKTAITDLVSTRIYPLEIPQNATLPAVRLTVVAGGSVRSQDGTSLLGHQTVQVDAISDTWIEAHTVAETIRKELDFYKGTAGSITVRGIHAEDHRMLDDRPGDASDEKQYGHSRDYRVWFIEAAVNT